MRGEEAQLFRTRNEWRPTNRPTDWTNAEMRATENEREREKKGINQYQETYKMSLKHFHHYVDGYVWLAEWNLWWIRRMLGIFGIMVSWLVNAFLIFFVVVSDLTHSVSVSVSLSLSHCSQSMANNQKSVCRADDFCFSVQTLASPILISFSITFDDFQPRKFTELGIRCNWLLWT